MEKGACADHRPFATGWQSRGPARGKTDRFGDFAIAGSKPRMFRQKRVASQMPVDPAPSNAGTPATHGERKGL